MTSTICGWVFLLEKLGWNHVYYESVWYMAGLEGFICFVCQYETTTHMLLAIEYVMGFMELGSNH